MSDVRLPRAIRAQQQAAEALQAQLNQPAPSEGFVPVAELAAPEPAPAPAPTPEPTPAPAPAPAPAASNDWEQKYKTLQGMFRAELNQQVASQLQQSRQRETELLSAVQQLQQEMRQVREKPAANTAPDPKDVEAFGIELVEMVSRNAGAQITSAVAQAMSEVVARLDRLEQQNMATAKSAALSAEQVFYSELDRLVPDWKAVNGDAGFLTWLGEADPVYGEPRQVALDRASQVLNADRAAAVFKAFKATIAQPAAQASRSDLESQVAPSRSGASAAPADTGPRYVSQAEVVKFYDDQRRGVYRGREQEAVAIEAGINKAIAEGRIR